MNSGSKIISYLQSLKYRVLAYNIVYIEGVDPDTFELNGNSIDCWSDTRNVIRDDGKILQSCYATVKAGQYWMDNPMNEKGCAKVCFGQHKDAWTFGDHKGQDALVQCGNISVYRNLDSTEGHKGNPVDTGDDFCIDQHTTRNGPSSVGMWSAGCLVGQFPASHLRFMQLCRDSGKKTFDTTVMDGRELHQLGVL